MLLVAWPLQGTTTADIGMPGQSHCDYVLLPCQQYRIEQQSLQALFFSTVLWLV